MDQYTLGAIHSMDACAINLQRMIDQGLIDNPQKCVDVLRLASSLMVTMHTPSRMHS